MQRISGLISTAVWTSAGVREPSENLGHKQEHQEHVQRPVRDEYIPESKGEPTGRYWMEKDGKGKRRIYFDGPGQEDSASGGPGSLSGAERVEEGKKAAASEKKADEKKASGCTGSTDKVDREIEKLKRKKEKLEQQLNSETDESRIQDLERELAQVERELSQKDNDTYRRQHMEYRSF